MAKEPAKAGEPTADQKAADEAALKKLQSPEAKETLARQVENSKLPPANLGGIAFDEPMVLCEVPKSFVLTLDDHRRIRIPAGTANLPQSLVEHFYVKAHGVKPAEPAKPKD